MFDFLINGLFDHILAGLLPKKLFSYTIPLLMAISGVAFGYIFGYIVYDLIIDPKNPIKIVVVGIMSLFILGLSFGSFYLMGRAWKSRNN